MSTLEKIQGILQKITLKKLQKNGLKIGQNCCIGNKVTIDASFCWLITIGNDCTITDHVIILAHDASTKKHINLTKIGGVTIGNKCFIGMGAIILPGTRLGNNVIIGAGSVVNGNIPDNSIVAGNPARIISDTQSYIKKHSLKITEQNTFPMKGWTINGGITEANKIKMKKAIRNSIAYIE